MNDFCKWCLKKAFKYNHLRQWCPAPLYLKYQFEQNMGYELDLKHPKTFNEKLQWLKLHDRNPLYTTLVDKYEAKKWVAEKIGEQYIIPTLAVYDSVDEIKLEDLPDQFVLKCTHDSGSIVICKDKSLFDWDIAKAKLQYGLDHNYYWYFREWPYKNVKPRVIAEPYVEDKRTHTLPDYKFYCFDGKVKALLIVTNRFIGKDTHYDFFDADFHHLKMCRGTHSYSDILPDKPSLYDKMNELAAILSQGMPHVRCDFYQLNEKLYWGEMTFFPNAGIVPFDPMTFDELWGDYIELPYNL